MQWKERWFGAFSPKTVLIQPPESNEYSAIQNTFSLTPPPTWAAILASETQYRRNQNLRFELIYPPQADMSDEFVKKCADSDILGLTDWFSCHKSAMQIAKRAKRINPKLITIIGGVNAKFLAPRILKNHPYIDLIVSGDGEDVLWRVQENHSFSSIPNLWYRDANGNVKFTYQKKVDLNEIGLWDFQDIVDSALLRDYYIANYNPAKTAPLGVSMTRGCQKCQGKGPCIYCTAYGKYRETAPQKAYNQLKHLEWCGFKHLFETGDDFSNLAYLKSLADLRTSSDNFKLRCYANPAKINQKVAEIMAKLGIYEVFLGFETSSSAIIKIANRLSISIEEISKVIYILDNMNISVCLPIMFGLPGETVRTAIKTANKVLEMVNKHKNIRMVLVSLAIPLVGSKWFKDLAKDNQIVNQYNKTNNLFIDDNFDYFKLLQLSLKKEGVKISHIVSILNQLREKLGDKADVAVGKFGAIESS
ncbi:MAG: radical SAM protein [Xanthomonadaceae bacterium]|nr:radical SAM protein [Rhodospirillaceae bacterium]NIA17735.1 radical SAM protein [Xanthomonadaceae bacterium]